MRPGTSTGRRVLLGGTMALLAGCATQVQTTGTYVGPPGPQAAARLPRPPQVLVFDFTVDWQEVQLDQGLRARLKRQSNGGDGTVDRQTIAAEVQAAIADTLVDRIDAMGLHAVRATPSTRPRPGDVVVGGQITKVDAGNATRRTLIGFGAGKSEIYADVQVSEATPGDQPRLLQTYDADANSGRAPGMGMGAASAAAGNTAVAVAGTAVGTVSRFRAGLPRDGEHLANRVSVNLGRFFAQQGWIDPSAVPSISR